MRSVSIIPKAHVDPRFDFAAAELGLGSRWDVVGRMIPLWAAATELCCDVLPEHMIATHFGRDGVPILCKHGLLKQTKNGFAVRGFSDHLAWLERSREDGKAGAIHGHKGGRPRKSKSPQEGIIEKPPGGLLGESQEGIIEKPPLLYSPLLSSTLPRERVTSDEAPTQPAKNKKPRKTKLPVSFEPSQEHRDFAAEHKLDLESQLKRFRLHYTANGKTAENWAAQFELWLEKSAAWERDKPRQANGQIAEPKYFSRDLGEVSP